MTTFVSARRLSRLACVALCLALSLGAAADSDPPAGIRRAVQDASRALQAGNAALFLAAFDRKAVESFGTLREQVFALTAQRRVASSVEVRASPEDPDGWTVEVEWLLHLSHKLDPGPVERRESTVRLGMRRRAGRWKIVRIEPVGFFAAASDESVP